ncbi:hypothetical protein OSB04_010405 [Centaurea solstitialis]|uniref:PB1 domain-containing protein n=1 Tax=Centaurea solstitialis TaxID=347529 RepID=A0AA38TIA9_9ASTR|nr:hypothetical protein OSB04_010405 [Centaurea solstitialis]
MAKSPPSSPEAVLSETLLANFPTIVQTKIRRAFDNLDDDGLIGLIQFWAPVKIGRRWLLTASDQPFLLDDEKNTKRYRQSCVKYKYDIDDVTNKVEDENEEDPTIIKNGAPATAYLNQMPEFFDEMSPLASFSVECGLVRSVVLPVFYPSQSCCVGVVECCSGIYRSLIVMFNHLTTALQVCILTLSHYFDLDSEISRISSLRLTAPTIPPRTDFPFSGQKREGLKLFDPQEHIPYKVTFLINRNWMCKYFIPTKQIICGLQHAKDEIDDALALAWDTVHLDYAQVWIAYKYEDHVAFSSSLTDIRTKRMLGFTLTDRYDDSYCFCDNPRGGDCVSECCVNYGRICSMLSLKVAEGLLGKTLQNYGPHFVRKVSNLRIDEPWTEGASLDCSCFVICLRSTETSDLEYVFEFLWRESSNYVKLCELLLSSLKRRLPSFKYASGEELCDELCIIDVENSTESEIRSFKVFQGKKSSSTSKASKESSRVVKECVSPLEAKCKATPISLSQDDDMIEAANNLDVCLSTLKRKCNDPDTEWHRQDYLKRNVNHSHENVSDKNEDEGASQGPSANSKELHLDENTVTIKAEYANDLIKLRLPISSATFIAIGNEIGKRFKLNPDNYKLKCLDEDGDWILLTCDEDIKHKTGNLQEIKKPYLEYPCRTPWKPRHKKQIMADSPPSSPADVLSGFLATFSTLVQHKIRRAFANLHKDLDGLVQFWAPVKIGRRWLLTTSDQPFLLDDDKDTEIYRFLCLKYKYNIDVINNNNNLDVEDDPSIISTGAPATAFLNQSPELVRDTMVYETSPLASFVAMCGLDRSLVLPVFYPSQSCCVGVVECRSSVYLSLIDMFDDLNTALQEEGLKLFQPQEHLPYKTICGLKQAKNDIDEILELAWETVRLDFAQVWVAYKDEDDVALSSSMVDNQTKRMLGFKLTDRYHDPYRYCNTPWENDYVSQCYVGYSRICYMLSLKMGEGLIGKTLKNYEPHFVRKVSNLRNDEPLTLLSSYEMEGVPFDCSCFVVCLRSTETSDLVYVFEFIWYENSNYVNFCQSLLLLLKRCFPNFKYASGGELGDELCIMDVESSTESEIRSFKIFHGNESSSTSKALEKRSPMVKRCAIPLEVKCKATPISLSKEDLIEATKNLSVRLSDYLKRNVNQSYNDKNEEDEGASQDPSTSSKEMYLYENTVTIKAEYADDMIKLCLRVSSTTFVAIGNEVSKRFKLNLDNYKLKCLDEDGDWILVTCDEDIKVCIKDRRDLSGIVRLLLHP